MADVRIIGTGKAPSVDEMLAVLDVMREAIVRGELIAFVAAGVTAADVALGYSASTHGVTRLRMIGALSNLLHRYNDGALGNDE